jgi:hypothetical protein
VHRLLSLLLLLAGTACCQGQTQGQSGSGGTNQVQPAQGLAILDRALQNEYKAAQDASHPMRYELRKTSPHWSSTKKICETKDGDVARLVELNGQPLSAADEQKEEARLTELAGDPGKQRRRKQAEDEDQGRVLKVLRALPAAFVYQDAGAGEGPAEKPGVSPSTRIEKFTFKPSPGYSAPDLEIQVLTQMAGEIWVDPVHLRVVRLEGHLVQDVDFGWGILGRLNKGGWIVIDQADVGPDMGVDQWRTVHFKMVMSGRVVWKTRVFDTSEDESGYEPVPAGLGYQKAIEMLRADP